MDSNPIDDLLSTFDQFIQKISDELTKADECSQQNLLLKNEIKEVMNENNLYKNMNKDIATQCHELENNIKRLNEDIREKIVSENKEIKATIQVATIKNEFNKLVVKTRSLEKEGYLMKGEIERLTRENQALHRRIQDLNSNQETNLLVRKHVIDSKHETESRKGGIKRLK